MSQDRRDVPYDHSWIDDERIRAIRPNNLAPFETLVSLQCGDLRLLCDRALGPDKGSRNLAGTIGGLRRSLNECQQRLAEAQRTPKSISPGDMVDFLQEMVELLEGTKAKAETLDDAINDVLVLQGQWRDRVKGART